MAELLLDVIAFCVVFGVCAAIEEHAPAIRRAWQRLEEREIEWADPDWISEGRGSQRW